MPTGKTTKESVKFKMRHNIRDPERTVDMFPELKNNSLISASKFMDANYTTVLILEEVLIYDGNEVKSQASGQLILTVWICKTSGMWRLPLDLFQPNMSCSLSFSGM